MSCNWQALHIQLISNQSAAVKCLLALWLRHSFRAVTAVLLWSLGTIGCIQQRLWWYFFDLFVIPSFHCAGKWGSVFTVSIMMVGCILLTLTGIGLSGRQMAIWYIIAQVISQPQPLGTFWPCCYSTSISQMQNFRSLSSPLDTFCPFALLHKSSIQ